MEVENKKKYLQEKDKKWYQSETFYMLTLASIVSVSRVLSGSDLMPEEKEALEENINQNTDVSFFENNKDVELRTIEFFPED